MLTAWERHHEVGPPLPVYVVEGVHDLEAQADEVEALVAEVAADAGEPVAVIEIDTFAAAWPHGESNDEMAAFLSRCRQLAEATGAAVLTVHHPGHEGGRERGGSALRAGVDLSLGVERSGDRGTITAAKVRGALDGMTWGYRLEVVDFGHDAEGEPITACVAVETAAPPTGPPKLTNNEVFTLRGLVMAASFGTANGGGHVVDLERWREVAYRLMPSENADSKRKGFNRAREALVRKGFVHFLDDCYSVAPDLAIPPDILRNSEQVAEVFN